MAVTLLGRSGGAASRRAMPVVALALALATVGLAGCGSGDGKADRAPTTDAATTDATSTDPGDSTTSTTAACDPATAIRAMPLRARAALLVVVPVLDFELDGLAPVLGTGVGGVLFLGHADAPRDLAARIERARDTGTRTAPLLVMADQEGGGVQRLEGVVDSIPWARELAASSTAKEIEATATSVAQQMQETGVDMDLAPVLDVDDRPGPSADNPAGQRSFSGTADGATEAGLAFARGLQAGGVIPVVKHFPGLGYSTANTDNGAASTKPIDELRKVDLLPFKAAIDAGLPAVMVANATIPGLTDEPASVAPEAIDGLLRDELGFDGLVVTDSLSAEAMTDAGYTLPEAAAASVIAGADLILFGSTLDAEQLALLEPDAVAQTSADIVAALMEAVGDGRLPEERLDEAVSHVLAVQGVDPCEPAG